MRPVSSHSPFVRTAASCQTIGHSAVGCPAFTRATIEDVDQRGRIPRGNVRAAQSRNEYVSEVELTGVGNALKRTFVQALEQIPSGRAQVRITLENGQTASVKGDKKHQNIRCATRSGVIEVNVGVGGPMAVRGLRTQADLMNFLTRLHNGEWGQANPA